MTCIVGLIDGDSVVMGADSGAVSGWCTIVRKDPKIFLKNDMLIGVSGTPRMTQLLKYSLDVQEWKPGQSTFECMVSYFSEGARKCFRDGGILETENGIEKFGGNILIGVDGRLFTIGNDFQVSERVDSYSAIGSAREVALGALYATELAKGMSPEARISIALAAAAYHDMSISRPFVILETGSQDDRVDENELEFVECEVCASTPGSPTLCKSCRSNRATIERLKRDVLMLKAM